MGNEEKARARSNKKSGKRDKLWMPRPYKQNARQGGFRACVCLKFILFYST